MRPTFLFTRPETGKLSPSIIVFLYYQILGRLGNVTEADVPRVLDEILQRQVATRVHGVDSDADARPLCIAHWRGRTGLDKEQQIALYEKHQP